MKDDNDVDDNPFSCLDSNWCLSASTTSESALTVCVCVCVRFATAELEAFRYVLRTMNQMAHLNIQKGNRMATRYRYVDVIWMLYTVHSRQAGRHESRVMERTVYTLVQSHIHNTHAHTRARPHTRFT